MRRFWFLVMVLVPVLGWSQVRPIGTAFTKVGSATTSWAAVSLRDGSEKDYTLYNRDTGTDTLIVALNKADTLAASRNGGKCLFILAGEAHYLPRLARDTIWVIASGTTPYTITGVLR
jgi:hypothetical protein